MDDKKSFADYFPIHKRFLLFNYADYYPSGGIADVEQSFDSIEDATEHVKGISISDACYLYDRIEGKIVLDFNP